MTPSEPLFLHEEVMLLALRNHKGTVAHDSEYRYAIGGAILAELLLRERVRMFQKSKKESLVEPASREPVGDPLLDECLVSIHDSKRRGTPLKWVSRFAAIKRLEHRVAERLCDRRILKREEGKVLRVFSRKTYPEFDPRPEQEIVERLRTAIFTDSSDVDPRTVVVLSLAHSTELLPTAFDKKKLKERKARIRQLIADEMTGKAAAEAIRATHDAALAAAVVIISGSDGSGSDG